MTSVEGKSYIDFCQSFGPNLLGHRDPDVQVAVEQAVREAWTFGACEPYSLELSEWILERLKFAEKIRFVCSGTEAVMSALRLARAVTGRTRVLKFNGCYNGHVDSLLVKAGSGLAAGEGASDSAGISENVAKETLVSPLNNEEAYSDLIQNFGSEIAAVILEPLPANFGLLPQRKEFLEFVCRKARDAGALVIFDEVITGFRVKMGGMAEVLNLEPDLVTYGKVIGGGFPVGAYAGPAKWMDRVSPSGDMYQAGTLAANPIGMRAGLASLQKVEKWNVIDDINGRTENFAKEVNLLLSNASLPVKMVYRGSLFWLHINETEDIIRAPEAFHPESVGLYKKIFLHCIEQGLYLAPSAFEVGFVSYAHDQVTLEKSRDILVQAIKRAYEP